MANLAVSSYYTNGTRDRIVSLLTGLGHTTTYIPYGSLAAADLSGYDALVWCAGYYADAATRGPVIRAKIDAGVPCLFFAGDLGSAYDTVATAAGIAGHVYYYSSEMYDDIKISSVSHAITNGYAADAVVDIGGAMRFTCATVAEIGAGAKVLAYGDPAFHEFIDRAALFTYEEGAIAADGNAVGARVVYLGFPWGNSHTWTTDGTTIVSQAVDWVIAEPVSNTSPTPGFSTSVVGLEVSVTSSATDAEDGVPPTIEYDYGEGGGWTTNTTHTYATDGEYTITQRVTDSGGLTATTSAPVSVETPNVPPVAGFTHSQNYLEVSVSSTATDSDGSIVDTEYNYGDGTGWTYATVHTYAANGTYNIEQRVEDDRGGVATVSHEVSVAANEAPVPGFIATVDGPDVSVVSTATDEDGVIVLTEYDYGDGEGWTTETSHTYAADGDYTITQRVEDDQGLTATSTPQVITANAPNILPSAAFSYEVSGYLGSFTNLSTDPDGLVASYLWEFGDEDTSTEENPSHIFETSGIYEVRLTILDNEGGSSSVVQSVLITIPTVRITQTVVEVLGYPKAAVQFSDVKMEVLAEPTTGAMLTHVIGEVLTETKGPARFTQVLLEILAPYHEECEDIWTNEIAPGVKCYDALSDWTQCDGASAEWEYTPTIFPTRLCFGIWEVSQALVEVLVSNSTEE